MVVSETWLNSQVKTEAISLTGYHPPVKRDSLEKRGGGVLCCVRRGVYFTHWKELHNEDVETVWITVRPKCLPRNIPLMIIGVVYHPPPPAQDGSMLQLTYHPESGIPVTETPLVGSVYPWLP